MMSEKIKVLYACCYKAVLDLDSDYYDITYVDILPGLEKPNGKYLCCDIRKVNFSEFDIIVASPPCNYYSRAVSNKRLSLYAKHTKDLLPYCINYCCLLNKPFIVENVRNYKRMYKLGLFNYPCYYVFSGRHTYWTNYLFNPCLLQKDDNITKVARSERQGGDNVNNTFKEFIVMVSTDA